MTRETSTAGGALSGATTLRFSLPLPPNLANARMHWAAKHHKRQSYFEACDNLQLAGQVPPPPATPLAKAVIYETLYVGSEMDDDNAAHRVKWAIDWLKTRGYIADDKRGNLLRKGYPDQRVRLKPYRLEITLTEIKAA